MTLQKRAFALTLLLLFAGAAVADGHQDSTGMSDDHADECDQERQEAYDDADEHYRDDMSDSNNDTDNETAERERDAAYAEADEEYQECLQDARDDHDDDHDENEGDSLPIPDAYNGDHISFDVTSSGAANYTVDGVLVFSSVAAGHDAAWEEYRLREPSVKLEGEDVELKAADVESGVFVFEADGQITVVFPDGVNVTAGYHADHDEDDSDDSAVECESEYQEEVADAEMDRDEAIADGENEAEAREEYAEEVADAEQDRKECLADAREEDDEDEDDSDFLTLKGDEFQAILYTEEGYSLENQILTTTEEIRLILGKADGLSKESTKGIADGQIAAGVEVPRRGAPVAAEYDDVQVTLEVTDSGLIATVNRDDPEGRTILFTLEEGSLDLDSLTVRFDGEEIQQADNMADLRNTDDGAEYLILLGANGAEVLVQVPHFSPHTIELGSSPASANIPGPSMVFVASGLLGLAAVAARRN